MRKIELTRKRTIANQLIFYKKKQKEIASSKIRMRNARLRRGLYKYFYSEFKVLLDYASLKYQDKNHIYFKWVGEKQQGKTINYDGEIYYKNQLLERVEVTCPLFSIRERIIEQELNEKGSSTIKIESMKEKLDEQNLIIEAITRKKNSMHTYNNTITLVIYLEDMKYYFTSIYSSKKSFKNLETTLKKITYQFKEVFIVENLYMYSKKKLIKIK